MGTEAEVGEEEEEEEDSDGTDYVRGLCECAISSPLIFIIEFQ